MSKIDAMSPFWKNVNDELRYQGMNLKTLAFMTGVPYSTITNGKNRADSIPTADVALKISKVLNKSLEWLLGEDGSLPKNAPAQDESALQQSALALYHKYERLILALETLPMQAQTAITDMAVAVSRE